MPVTIVLHIKLTMAEADEAASLATISKLTSQLRKLTEANAKYKKLLNLAKDRIQKQEEEIGKVREENDVLEERLAQQDEKDVASTASIESGPSPEEVTTISRVRLRTKVPISLADPSVEEIWALLEMEATPSEFSDPNQAPRRYKEWKRFNAESELKDFIRRDTGEPLTLPPYSLSPDQSALIEQAATEQVSEITEEFRRFRVRSELARKQANAQIRDLQSNHAQTAARRIEGHEMQHELELARTAGGKLDHMKAELAAQEVQWKEAYDVLLAENNALKSSGSEALLAAQWRQRYESCLQEKEDLESRLKMETEKLDQADAANYEEKYRDLKESFRLYRKKAKEIFEAQQRSGGDIPLSNVVNITDQSSADAKLSYLKNLMVNYLTSEQAVKDHMESAIGTVLHFTPADRQLIKEKKAEAEAWF